MAHCHDEQPRFAYDWEYAATGNRFFDLASCIEVNKLSEKDAEQFLSAYWEETQQLNMRSPYNEAQVIENAHMMRSIVLFTNDLWILASQS